MLIFSPALRKAISRRRWLSTSNWKSVVSKTVGVGLEPHRGPALVGGADLRDLLLRHAAGVALLVHLPVAGDLQAQPLAERVHDRDADAVKSAGDLVGAVLELSAGVELGHHHVDRVHAAHGGMRADRDAAPVILHADAAVDVDGDDDLGGCLGQRLVDAVVHDLVDQVVEAVDAGVADVHPGALPDRPPGPPGP
jgi:hypothetical protein